MTRTTLRLLATVIAFSSSVYACGMAGLSDFDSAGAPGGDPKPAPGSDAAGDVLAPTGNAVILVHAAKSQPFRLCFGNELDRRPQPDSQVMPEANVVGVEVGSAVRIGALRGPPGEVYLFEEPLLRPHYPVSDGLGAGPTCRRLLDSGDLSKLASKLGPVDTNLAQGVHLLVVKGCSKNTLLKTFSVAECGTDWTSANGNLSVAEIQLRGASRSSAGVLPVQVLNLSQPLESARGARDVVVSFGELSRDDSAHVVLAPHVALFDAPHPKDPVTLPYASSDTTVYESIGFRVRLAKSPGDAGPDGGGPSTRMLDESLAHIQKLSSPRDVPTTYYAAASNYALLLLGDPAAKLDDGGADDDGRRRLHFLAVPVIGPKGDGGAPDAEAGTK